MIPWSHRWFSAALTTDFHNRAELISRCINLSFSKKFCQADNAIGILLSLVFMFFWCGYHRERKITLQWASFVFLRTIHSFWTSTALKRDSFPICHALKLNQKAQL